MLIPKKAIVQFGTLIVVIFCSQSADAQIVGQPDAASAILNRPQKLQNDANRAASEELYFGYNPSFGLTTLDFRQFTAFEANYHRTRGGTLAGNLQPRIQILSGQSIGLQRQNASAWEAIRKKMRKGVNPTHSKKKVNIRRMLELEQMQRGLNCHGEKKN